MKRTFSSTALLVLTAAAMLAGFATGQEASPDVKALVTDAYKKSTEAKTVDDLNGVAELCQKALDAKPPAKDFEYTRRLLSWTQNRRGELQAEQAAELLKQGKAQEAAELDAKALADFEESVKNDATRWKALHNRGVSYAVAGKYVEAIQDFSKAIEFKADYANTWFNRGEIRYEMGEHQKALEDYNQAIKLDATDAGAFTSRGHTHFQLKRFREALSDYNTAVRLAPSNAEFLTNRADAHRSLSMWEQAANDYRRAISLNDKLGRSYQSAAWLMATCPDQRYRDAARALEAAQKAIELDGENNFRYLDTLAAAYAEAGRFDEAQATEDKAIKAAPKDELAKLKKRLELYGQKKPYRQGMDESAG